MKTQNCGCWDDFSVSVREGVRLRAHLWFPWGGRLAQENFKEKRVNGGESDNPSQKMPEDGKYTWVKGRVEGDYVYGVKRADGNYDYEVRYDQGPGDKAWMEEKDKNYLERIEREGNLKKLEPAVYYLRLQEHATNNIREWWTQKLLLPNLPQILEQVEIEALEALTKAGANVDLADEDGNTPLFAAVQQGHKEALEALTKAGAKVDLADKAGKMKIQTFGYYAFDQEWIAVEDRWDHPSWIDLKYMRSYAPAPFYRHLLRSPFREPYQSYAAKDFKKNRENGSESDNPSQIPMEDGKHTVVIGSMGVGGYIYGVKNGNKYEYKIRYDQGPGDKAWFEEKDKNYLERIEREGNLCELEPVIWYMRQKEQAINNIRDWWAQKLLLPNLSQILTQASREYNAIQLKANVIGEAIDKINSYVYVRISFTEIVTQCVVRAEASDWYTHPDLPANTTPYDFSLNEGDLNKIFFAIRECHNIKILDLSNISFYKNKTLNYLLLELFRVRNDFIELNFSNTNLSDEKLSVLLVALRVNQESRGVPLIRNLNLAGNRITSVYSVVEFIYECAHNYYWKQHPSKATTSSVQSLQLEANSEGFPLFQVNLECNLISLTENADEILQRYDFKLHEQESSLHNLTICLAGNAITIHAPRPFQEVKRNEWRYSFFVTQHLTQRRSVMQPDQQVTPEDGFVYLACKKKCIPWSCRYLY
jgi:hypothetical protein